MSDVVEPHDHVELNKYVNEYSCSKGQIIVTNYSDIMCACTVISLITRANCHVMTGIKCMRKNHARMIMKSFHYMYFIYLGISCVLSTDNSMLEHTASPLLFAQ